MVNIPLKPFKQALQYFHQQPVKVKPTLSMAASSGSENLEISIYTTLYSFVKVSLGFFSFFTPKIRTSLWQFRASPMQIIADMLSQKTDTLMIVSSFRFNGNMFSAEGDAVFIDCFYTF